jgi:hypothetical protein
MANVKTQDLKALAQLKIKLNLIKDQYDKKCEELMEELKKDGFTGVVDPEKILSVGICCQPQRNFNIEEVKKVVPKAIKESVDAKEFDAAKLDTDTCNKCFSTTYKAPYLLWEGLKQYQAILVEKVKAKEEKNG